MADFLLPIESGKPFFNFETDLTGQVFSFQFQYNKREDSWYMNILNADTQIAIRSGIKIVVNDSLLSTLRDFSISPKGQFVAINSESINEDPNFDSFGNEVQLLYLES